MPTPIASIQEAHQSRCEASRRRWPSSTPSSTVGDRPVWALRLQVLRELAQHAGHADILREQVIADALTDRQQQPDRDSLVRECALLAGHFSGQGRRPVRLRWMRSGRTVVLVEGVSDQVALEVLAARRGRDLAAEGTFVVPIGGSTSIGRCLRSGSVRSLEQRPAQRGRGVEERLHRFVGARGGRKMQYARWLVEALDLTRVPRRLDAC